MTEDERTEIEILRIQQRALDTHRAEHPALSGDSAATCEACGNDIPEARRLAVPGVRLCVECKRAEEQQERNYRGL